MSISRACFLCLMKGWDSITSRNTGKKEKMILPNLPVSCGIRLTTTTTITVARTEGTEHNRLVRRPSAQM